MKKALIVMFLLFISATAYAEPNYIDDAELPAEIRSFILPKTRLLAMEKADLNRDGLEDYLLVLEKQNPEQEEGQRPLLILTRLPDGSLKLVKQNHKLVYCSSCGGMMGDPFQGVKAGKGTFTVSHYGGSAWRWSVDTTFNYSRIDKTWQLVQVQHDSFHAGDPEKVKTERHRPPKDFGKIDIADFDPDNYLKKK
jgi:hypothetical protein